MHICQLCFRAPTELKQRENNREQDLSIYQVTNICLQHWLLHMLEVKSEAY